MAEALRTPVVTTGSALDLADYDRLLAEARTTVDTRTFADQILEGHAMPQAEAVAFTLRTFAEHD